MSYYKENKNRELRSGAILAYKPVPWIELPPLWIARTIQWQPRIANIYKENDNEIYPFRGENIQEEILACAKRRYIIVISSDYEVSQTKYRDFLFTPLYSIEGKDNLSGKDFKVLSKTAPNLFYFPSDQKFPKIKECYTDMRKISRMSKDYIQEKDIQYYSLTKATLNAFLNKYWRYLSSNRN